MISLVPTTLKVARAVVAEDTAIVYMSRTHGPDGLAITQAAISTISVSVYNKSTGVLTLGPDALVVADSVFDTLQTDSRWTEDSEGYNFRHALSADAFLEADATYQIEFTFTPTDGGSWKQLAEVKTVEVFGS